MDLSLIITGGILLGCFIGLSWFAGSDAPYVATKSERVKKALILSGLKKGETFYELGSGDGRVVMEAARMGAKAYGIEQSWIRILFSRWRAKKQNLPNAKFIHGDIFKKNLSKANVTFIFLLPKGIEKLEPVLRKSLKKDSRVITQTFHFKNWKPYKKELITDKNEPNTLLGKEKYEGEFWYYRV
jgi:predicted RNA methylase